MIRSGVVDVRLLALERLIQDARGRVFEGAIMAVDWLPRREAECLAKLKNLAAAIESSASDYPLPAGLADEYGAAVELFAEQYAVCQSDLTRSPANIRLKDELRSSAAGLARRINKILQADERVSPVQKQTAGLPVHSTSRSPTPAPAFAPVIENLSVFGNRVSYTVRGTSPSHRREINASALSIFYALGDAPPTSVAGWIFVESTSKLKVCFDLPAGTPFNTKVWTTCFWVGARSQSSPACQPAFAYTTHAAVVPMPPAMNTHGVNTHGVKQAA